MGLHRSFCRQKTTKTGDAKGGMWVGVPTCIGRQPGARALHWCCVLAVTGHPVIFGVTANGGPVTIVPSGAKGGWHPGGTFFDLEPFMPQQINIEFGRAILAPGGFAVFPDRFGSAAEFWHSIQHIVLRKLLRVAHRVAPAFDIPSGLRQDGFEVKLSHDFFLAPERRAGVMEVRQWRPKRVAFN